MQISDAEWDVMRVIWNEEPRTAAEVIAALEETHDWNHRTIRTLLARLVEKQALSYDVDGTRYLYRSAVKEDDCIQRRGQSFVSKVFGGDVSALVAHFVQDNQLTDEEIAELSRLLEEKSKTTGQKTTKRSKRK